jgi:hypothetical protein
LPAKQHVAGGPGEADFRLNWADFGWLRDNGTCRCP